MTSERSATGCARSSTPDPPGHRGLVRRRRTSHPSSSPSWASSACSACTSTATAARARCAVEYGLAAQELEAGDSGMRTFVSVQGSLAMRRSTSTAPRTQKQEWLPGMATGEVDRLLRPHRARAGRTRLSMTSARLDGRAATGWVLDGAKRWIGLASIADVLSSGPRPTTACAASSCRPSPGVHCDADRAEALDARVDPVRRHPRRRAAAGTRSCRRRRGLRGPFACLNEARYGIVWGAIGAARDASRPPWPTRRGASSSAGRSRGSSSRRRSSWTWLLEIQKGALLALHLGRLKDAGASPRRRSRSASSTTPSGARLPAPHGRSWPATASRSTARGCGTRATWRRCAPTRAPTRCTRSCWAGASPVSPPSADRAGVTLRARRPPGCPGP